VRAQPSTIVEEAVPKGGIENNSHHNIPRSRCGSNEGNNLSDVEIPRHDAFHQLWGSNALPTELIRHVAIHSIGMPNRHKRLDASQVRELFDATSNQDTHRYYWSDATLPSSDVSAAGRSLQNLRTTAHFLQKEQVWVRDTIAAIRGEEQTFPSDNHALLQNSLSFFEARTPATALQEFLTEKNKDELSWCKAMRQQKRSQILRILEHPSGTPTDERKEYIHPLLMHHSTLDQQAREIEKAITRLNSELQKMLQMSVLRPDGDA
jgi:hypothetical protein